MLLGLRLHANNVKKFSRLNCFFRLFLVSVSFFLSLLLNLVYRSFFASSESMLAHLEGHAGAWPSFCSTNKNVDEQSRFCAFLVGLGVMFVSVGDRN